MNVLLDMDGVLVDFAAGILDALGKSDLADKINGWDFWKAIGVTEKEFWEPCNHEPFWSNLSWTEEGPRIVMIVYQAVGKENTYLLTSPSRAPRSYSGKAEWVKRHLPNLQRRLLIGPSKHLFASPRNILIDDGDHNVDAFRAAGGKAILVPRPWNKNRGKPVLETVQSELREYTDALT